MTTAQEPSQPNVAATAVPEGVDPAAYAKQMADRADGKPAPQEQPKLLAGKYKSVEELEKGYAELMKLHGRQAPQEQTQQQQQQTQQQNTDPAKATQEQAEQAVQQAGLDFGSLTNEYETNGGLTDASYEALAKAGIPKEIVDQFISGQEAARSIARNEVHSIVGGAEQYGQLVGWAKDNLDAGEIAAFNKIANGGDLSAIKIAVQGLKSRYDNAFGSEPNLVADNLGAGSVTGYRSKAEMTKDMADPRYQNDPAFRQDVMNKLRATTAF
jgi:hypothetical protein